MRIVLRHPKRQELEIVGRRQVRDLLRELGLNSETVLVIRGDTLLTRDALVSEDDIIEIRPVISGG